MKITYYKLHCLDKEIKEVYIGSTEDLKHRINKHRSKCKLDGTQVVYMFINVNGGFDNWAFEILDEIEVESKVEKLKIERKFSEKYPLNLNYDVPGRTKKEWSKDNRKKRNLYYKKYYYSNSEKKKLSCKKYYYSNPEKIKQKYQKNKTKRYECECGSNVRYWDKSEHFRSKKHINYIELNK